MFRSRSRKIAAAALAVMAGIALGTLPARHMKGADHAEATGVAGDPGADIADVFAFLDPNDNSKVVLALDVEGFIVPSELLNLSFFSPDVTYRFEIENTGDARPDASIEVTFSPQTSRSAPQTATIKGQVGSGRPHGDTSRQYRLDSVPAQERIQQRNTRG